MVGRRALEIAMLSVAISAAVVAAGAAEAIAQEDGSTTERVTGIGGFFPRAQDPVARSARYAPHIGVPRTPVSHDDAPRARQAWAIVFAPVGAARAYSGRPDPTPGAGQVPDRDGRRVLMAKQREYWVCRSCGADHAKWQGQCAACGEWNTLEEVRGVAAAGGRAAGRRAGGWAGETSRITALADVDLVDAPRIPSGFSELDRVLGGGLVPGSVLLIGGSPGAGKSTLLLQVSCGLAKDLGVLYVTGEESLQQIALRAQRLELPREALRLASETRVEAILAAAAAEKPRLLVVDSIQTLQTEAADGAPGGVTQVRESTARLVRFAKETGTIVVLVGHVNKEGGLAGPKVLEHMIDAFMMLEDASDSRFRTLRGHKNRFGAVNELGVFAMTDRGMREVANPSAIFLQRGEAPAAGSLVVVVWEGTRPLLVEVQALVDDGQGAHPRRVAVGVEGNRVAMLLAVLHRHAGLQLGDQDVFLNVVGGVRVAETGSDLAVLLALVSSFRDRALPQDLLAFGEVGLSGEVRPVSNGQERLREAAKHGFRRAICPVQNRPREGVEGLEVVGVRTLAEALDAAQF